VTTLLGEGRRKHLLASAGKGMDDRVRSLQRRFGTEWTHTLAINDVYFDHINVPLNALGRKDIRNISAGDGSAKALGRIHSGLSQQVATVAEPLGMQGWQLVDEPLPASRRVCL
jgi:ribose transport system substrate-binding protein